MWHNAKESLIHTNIKRRCWMQTKMQHFKCKNKNKRYFQDTSSHGDAIKEMNEGDKRVAK